MIVCCLCVTPQTKPTIILNLQATPEETAAKTATNKTSRKRGGSPSGDDKGGKKRTTKERKELRATKCGACRFVSRPCNLDCAYKPYFPSGTHREAQLITKTFDKETLIEMMEKCKNPIEITKCRANLFTISSFLAKDPVNTPLDKLDGFDNQLEEFKQNVFKQIDTIKVLVQV